MLAGKIGYFRASLDPAAAAYIAAVEAADGQALEAAVRTAINNFVVGCKADGIWSAIKASCILCGARTLSGALVPLVGAAPTNFNFVAGDYNRKTGLVGNASTKYLVTNRAGNADPQNSNHIAVYASTAHSNASNAGAYVATGGILGLAGASDLGRSGANTANLFSRSRNSTSFAIDGAGAATGFIGLSRSASASYSRRANGTSGFASVTSETPASPNYHIFRFSDASGYCNGRLAFYSVGESLDIALLDTRITTLYNAIGAAVVPQVSNADAQSWIDRVYANGGTVSTSTASAVNTFCNSIDAAGIRDRFFRLNLFAGTGLPACLVPLYRGQSLGGTQLGNATDTNNNFVSADYVETGTTGGLKGNGSTKSLDTGIANNVVLGTSRHLAVYEAEMGTQAFGATIGASGNRTPNSAWFLGYPSPATTVRYGGLVNFLYATAANTGPAFFLGTNDSTVAQIYRNNSLSGATSSGTAITPTTDSVLVFGMTATTSVINRSSARLGGYSLGLGMTASQASAYYTAIQAFQAALTRNV
jgi:hypothetical protein